MQLQRYGFPRPNYVVTTASYTNLGSHNNTLMVPGLPLKPSQHSRGPQQASRSITTFWWSSPNHCCHHNPPVGSKQVASDSPFRYPSHLGGPQTSNTYHSHLMVLRLSIQTFKVILVVSTVFLLILRLCQ